MGHLKEGFDTVGIDCYPLQTFEALEDIWVITDQGRKRMGNSRAMWNIPQIFDWEVYRHQKGYETLHNVWAREKPPTAFQLNNMIHQWIVGGGMGLIFYDYSEMIEMNWKSPFETEWKKVKDVVTEFKTKWVDIILSNEQPNPQYFFNYHDFVDPVHYVGVRHFRYKGADYILIVNVRQTAHSYQFIKPEGVTIEKLHGQSTISENQTTRRVTLSMPSADVVWLKGTGGSYVPPSIDISKPNLKSKFDISKSLTNENCGVFPKLPTIPDDPTLPPPSSSPSSNPNSNKPNGSCSITILHGLLLCFILM